MRTLTTIAATSAALVLGLAMSAFGADIVGTIVDSSGVPIPGVAVSVGTRAGTKVGTATSDSLGRYAMRGIPPGTYTLSTKGQTAVSYLGKDGLTVDWGLAPNAPAIATARPGTAPAVAEAGGNDRLAAGLASQDSQGGNGQGQNNNCQGQNGQGGNNQGNQRNSNDHGN